MKFKNRRLGWVGCLILVSSSASLGAVAQPYTKMNPMLFAQTDRIIIDEPFLRVRARVIQHGWKPARIYAKEGYSYDGAEKSLADRKIFEVDTCSMDAGANCIFYYRKKQKCLRIDTIGERVGNMKVTRWTYECPADES
jgi:hypothetical protein